MQKWVGLIDCNNFFVSCERLFRPDLEGKPVLVLSSNDGCVVARSQEIKDKGIPMGVPVFKIKDTLKDIGATTFSSHFALYRDISRRVFEVVRSQLGLVEQYSIDESFFVIEGTYLEVQKIAQTLKDSVYKKVGIPVSVGLGSSKTIAKYAAKQAKKTNGVFVMDDSTWEATLPNIALHEVWGIGARTAATFREKGLTTAEHFLALQERDVKGNFGVAGLRLWHELRGNSVLRVGEGKAQPQQSILHSRSFKSTSNDLSVIKDAIAYHVRAAAEDLRALKMKTNLLQVYLGTSRHGDYFLQGGSKALVFTAPTNDTFVLLNQALKTVEELFKPDVPYKKAGILLSDFSPIEGQQLEMFAVLQERKTGAISEAVDVINKKLGRSSVLIGSHLKNKDWESSSVHRSPAYTTSWRDIAEVKA